MIKRTRSRDSKSRCPIKPFIAPPSATKRPGDGFYQYVNGTWLQKTHIAPWRSEFGASDEIEEQTDAALLESIRAMPEMPPGASLRPKSAEDHLRLFQTLWSKKDFQKEETFLRIYLQELMENRGSTDLARTLGYLCRCRVPTLIEISTEKETHPPYFVRASIESGSLLLPDEYYTDSKMQEGPVWAAYSNFVGVCSIELGLPFLMKAIDAEVSLARYMNQPFSDKSVTKKGYKLSRMFSNFEWSAFMEGLDLDQQWQNRIWFIECPDKIDKLISWICKADDEFVVAIMALHFIAFNARHLRKPIRDAADLLFGKAIQGIEGKPDEPRQFLSLVKQVMPSVLCTFYSEKEHTPHILEDVKDLVLKMQNASIQLMKDTTVFTKSTKSSTQEKIRRMRFEIGKGPANPLPEIQYQSDSMIHASLHILSETSKMLFKSTGKPAHSKDGIYPCFQVNASYFPETNHIVLPWGILQWPNYCDAAPLGWNYGGLGATIGHEMTHAFDLEGSMYSPRGVFKETWTRKNRLTFKKQTRKVQAFFTKFKHFGKALDGKRTLSENWADLGGLKIALNALKVDLDSMKSSAAVRKEAYRNFFLAYAVSWRTLTRKEKLLYAMMTSVHAPAEDRVDRIVPQFQEWVDAFDIQEGDRLFIPEGERLKFF